MQLTSWARQSFRLLDDPLLPYTITSLAWLVIFGVLRTLSNDSSESAIDYLAQLLLALPVGLFWAALFKRMPNTVVMLALLLILATITSVALQTADFPGNDGKEPNLILSLTSLGGALIGWLIWNVGYGQSDALSLLMWRVLRRSEVIVAATLLFLGAVSLAPIHFSTGITDLGEYWQGSSSGGYFQLLLAHLYTLIKSIILWVPVGLVFGFAGLSFQLLNWVNAVLITCFLGGLSQLDWLTFQDIIEVACGALGVWLGLWLAKRTPLDKGHAIRVHDGSFTGKVQFQSSTEEVRSSVQVVAKKSSLSERGISSGAKVDFFWPAICRILASMVLIWVLWELVDFPRWQWAIGLGLMGYLVLLWRCSQAWLVVVPLTLPVLDFAPWTGRFFLDEFDLVMLVTLAAWLWRLPTVKFAARLPSLVKWLALSYGFVLLISLLSGLWPLQPLDENAFSSYWSQYNGLRVVKGYLWGWLLFLMLNTMPQERTWHDRWLFALGVVIGLAAAVFVSLRERWQFAGFFDFADQYRITGPFSSMHTGGGHIEAYLVFVLPLVWYFMRSSRNWLLKVMTAALLLLTVFIITTTIARGAVLALILVAGVFLVYGGRRLLVSYTMNLGKLAASSTLIILAAGVLLIGVRGEYFQERFARVESDLMTRINHWSDALNMMDDHLFTTLFGTGLGSFPLVYLQNKPQSVPGTYHFINEGNNALLRMGSGDTAYLTQRVLVEPGQIYTLTMDIRSDAPQAKLHVPLCERHLLHSYRCVWQSLWLKKGGSAWQQMKIKIDSGQLGSGNLLTRRYVEFTLYNQLPGVLVEIDNISLSDQTGQELLRNGNFSAGTDYWFYRTYSHLPFHIKNLWVGLFFEQGVLGVLLFTGLTLVICWQLSVRSWHGELFAIALLSSLIGFFGVGLFGSLFDAPRLTLLFFTVLLWGAARQGALLNENADA